MNKKNNLGLDICFMDEDNPFVLFKHWMSEAEKKEINDPNAVALATVNETNQPDVRMVLLKEFNNNGFVFFTNLNSKKGSDLKKNPKWKIQIVSDISCDIGFIACTLRESTISDPIYGYDPLQNTEVDYSIDDSLLVVDISNLPCELPIDSSIDFGRIFVDKIFPLFLKNDDSITDATICKNNRLTDKYIYLEDFLLG